MSTIFTDLLKTIIPFIKNDISFSYSTAPNNEFNNSHGGYWTASGANANANSNAAAGAGTKHIKPHNKRYSKVNVPVRVTVPLPPTPIAVVPPTSIPPLDAAKRKQLPAWIREGKTVKSNAYFYILYLLQHLKIFFIDELNCTTGIIDGVYFFISLS